MIRLLEESAELPAWSQVATQSRDIKVLWAARPRLAIRDGLLKTRFDDAATGEQKWQVIMPEEFRQEFMSIAHGRMTTGHLGQAKAAAAIQSRAYWPTWPSDLDAFLRMCHSCARQHRGYLAQGTWRVPGRATMQTPLVGEPWERVAVDITELHPKTSEMNQ